MIFFSSKSKLIFAIIPLHLIQNGTLLNWQFHFLDGHIKEMDILSSTTVAVALKNALRHLDLRETNKWSMYESDGVTGKLFCYFEYVGYRDF